MHLATVREGSGIVSSKKLPANQPHHKTRELLGLLRRKSEGPSPLGLIRPRVRRVVPPKLVFELIQVGLLADPQKFDSGDFREVLQVTRS
jgi:hypothetical protein